jgi:Leucine-rich repeat (LRR) protein
LRELRLSGNPLQKVESDAFEMVPQLVALDLSDCGLRRLAAKAFAHLTQLQKLDLARNKLTEIRHKTVESIAGNSQGLLIVLLFVGYFIYL